MSWLGWLLIGAALGWLIEWFMDRWWWSSRRVCTEDEIRLRGEVDGLNSRNGELQGQIAGFETERADWNTKFASMDGEIKGYQGKIGQFEAEAGDLKTRLGKFETDNTMYLGRIGEFEKSTTSLNAKIGDLTTENEGLRTKLGSFESDKASLEAKLSGFESEKATLQTKLGDFESKNLALASSISGLESDKVGLEGRIGEFDTQRASLEGRIGELEVERTNLQGRLAELEGVNADLNAQIGSLNGETGSLQARIDEMSAGNADLQAKLSNMERENVSLRGNIASFEGEIEGLKGEMAEMRSSAETNNAGLMMAATGTAAAAGVGLAAGMGDDDVAEVEEVEEIAIETAVEPEPELEDVAVAVEAAPEADDLKRLWGIGPASERVLNANGIYTFAQLCKADSKDLEAMLNDSNLNASILSEETWPEQACLAKDGKWDELDAMQVSLKAASGDDFQKLVGIGPKSEAVLYDAGIFTYKQLCKTSPEKLAEILEEAGINAALMNEETWTQQACLAADGDDEGLAALQGELKAAQADDFSIFYGLGPKSVSVLHDNDVYKYSQLAKSNGDALGGMLEAADVNADLMNEETWPEQARFAADGDMDGLAAYIADLKLAQADDFSVIYGLGPKSVSVLHDNDIYKFSQLAKSNGDALGGMLEAADVNADLMNEETWPEQARFVADGDMDGHAAYVADLKLAQADDFSIIYGLGPKSVSVLHDNDIYKYSQLAKSNGDALGGMLEAADVNADLMNEETWPEQARFAANGDNDGLAIYIEQLKAAQAEASSGAEAGAESAAEGDDLQMLWGVGPASAAVLNSNGITTYRDLANADAGALKAMLDEADGSFALSREETWPQQAQMVLDGDVDGFAAMQESLSAEYITRSVDPATFTGDKDDLTTIWGIGGAVQKMLNAKGVFTFAQLAGMQLSMVESIVASAGDRFNLARPEVWIPQAELLAAGDKDGFDALRKKISSQHS